MQFAGGPETHLAPRRRGADICAADSSRIAQASAPAMCEKCPVFRINLAGAPGFEPGNGGIKIPPFPYVHKHLEFERWKTATKRDTTDQGVIVNSENRVWS
jgi:hypothetical protein